MARYVSRRDAGDYVANLWEFRGSSMYGIRGNKYSGELGYLPSEWRTEFRDAFDAGSVEYVVVSYGTPIAWRVLDGSWIIPDVKYSSTTSRHQNIVKGAVR